MIESRRVPEAQASTRAPASRRLPMKRVRRFIERSAPRPSRPGSPLNPHDLFDFGWPNEQLPPDVALRRVYVGIAELRKLGLTDVLLHQTEGYLIAPQIPVMRQAE